ncbi:MAG: hypothetical protein ACREP1_04645, partial [Rhodanobacteraceae bacterium]
MKTKSHTNSGFFTPRLLLGLLLCLCGMSLAVVSFAGMGKLRQRQGAPTPASGTISPSNPTLTYSDGPFVIPNDTAQAGDPICTVPMSCSDFALTVDFSGGPDPDPTKQVTITVSWPVASADFDVYV